jgi:hypothetical protein
MPQRSNLIPRPVMPRFRESSALRSGRDSDDTSKVWQRCEQMAKEIAYLTNAVIRTQQELNRLRMRKGGATEVPVASESPAKVRLYQFLSLSEGFDYITCRPVPGYTLSAATSADGTGYEVNDILYVESTDDVDTHAKLKVLTVDGSGNPTSFEIVDGGGFLLELENPVAASPGDPCSGTGASLTCTFTEAASVLVALKPELRYVEEQEIDGDTINYGSYSAASQQRTARPESTGQNEIQKITPRFLENDLIPVASCTHTRVIVSDVELTLIEVSGREWAEMYVPIEE